VDDIMIKLGSFNVNSGRVVISDPCYDLGSWSQTVIDNVKTGQWVAVIEQLDKGHLGICNAKIIVYHSEHGMPYEHRWRIIEYDVIMDSGQVGFFDIEVFRNDAVAKPSTSLGASKQEERGERWYRHICDLATNTEEGAGVTEGGAVSSSGYGDGGYSLFIVRDNGQIVAMKIVFIPDVVLCEDCGESEDECCCRYCNYCNEKEGYCKCSFCDKCGEHKFYCECKDENE
jgi:hypothetical protein